MMHGVFFLHEWNTRDRSAEVKRDLIQHYQCQDCGLLVDVRPGECSILCRGDGWHEMRAEEHGDTYRLARGQRAESAEKRR